MNNTPRKFHGRVSPWLVLPLLIVLSTGITYRVGRAWFGMSKNTGESVLHIHTGAWLGARGSSAWILINGFGLLALVLTGLYLVATSRSRGNPRYFHRVAGAILMVPLAVSAVTGMAFHFGEKSFPKGTNDLLMSLHQGSWLGPALRPFYILAIGLGLLAMMVTGLKLAGLLRKRATRA